MKVIIERSSNEEEETMMKNTVSEMLERVIWKIENSLEIKNQKLEEISRRAHDGSEGFEVGSSIAQIARQLVELEAELRMLYDQKTMFEYLLKENEKDRKG